MPIVDFAEIEKKWQKKWLDAKLFEPKVDKNKKKFYLTVPYPYTSGPLHIGHARTYTMGDIFARFRRMQGFNVLWPMAFHMTGTPVLAVANQIKAKNKKTVDMYKEYISLYEKDPKKVEEIISSFDEPQNVANYFSSVITHDFNSIGFSIDWSRKFTTNDKEYNNFIKWQFKKFYDQGYIEKGSYPILYCVNDKNAVGEDDIEEGDIIKASPEEFVILKFKFNDAFIIAATLRPETVFGQTNLWVDPNIKYVKAKVDGEIWILSKEAAEKLKYQKEKVEIIGEISGKEIIGKYCTAPGIEKEIIILPSKFCDPDIGSGIVTSVPSDAPYDWMGLKDLQENETECKKYGLDYEKIKAIKVIPIIKTKEYGDLAALKICEDMKIKDQTDPKLEEVTAIIYKAGFHKGVMNENCGEYAGKPVSKAKDMVKKDLIKKKKADLFYEVTALKKPVKCRCGGDVVVSVLKDQWFINYDIKEWKKKAYDCLNDMVIYPKNYRKYFENTFEWLEKRPCARKRGLGTEFPFSKGWIIESLSDSTIYMAFYTVKKNIKKFKIRPEQLTDEFWDYVFLGMGNIEEVSSKTKVDKNQLEEMREEFLYWYPNDQRHTATAHISNHLSFFIFAHVAIFPKENWPKGITLNELLIREGTKMSKSKGNVIPLVEVPRKYSADLFRLYMAFAADFSSTLDWREKDVVDVRKKLQRFYSMLSSVKKEELSDLSTIDRWILSKINWRVKQATESLKNYKVREYVQSAFFDMLNDIGYYNKKSGKKGRGVMYYLAEKWLKIISPVIPHTCEELWEKIGNKGFISTEAWPEADEKMIDKKIEMTEDATSDLERDIMKVIELTNIKPKKIQIFIAPEWKRKVYIQASKIKNPKELIKKIMEDPEIKKRGKEAVTYANYLGKHAGELKAEILSGSEEISAIEDAKESLSKEFGAEVKVMDASKSNNPKAKNAIPLKPAIFVE